MERTGWCWSRNTGPTPPRLRVRRMLRDFFWSSSHPSSAEEGSHAPLTKSPEVCCRYKDAERNPVVHENVRRVGREKLQQKRDRQITHDPRRDDSRDNGCRLHARKSFPRTVNDRLRHRCPDDWR